MHNSLIDDVKLHIDHVTKKGKKVIIKGWCASESQEIKKIRLYANKKFSYPAEYGETREDVYRHYKLNTKFLNTGFNISVPHKLKGDEDIFLQILHKNKWENIKKLNWKASIHLKEINTNFDVNETLDTNLIVIDDFYRDPHLVRAFALTRGSYGAHLEHHKGQRTTETFKPDGVKEVIEKLLHKKIKNWDQHESNGVFQFCISEDPLVYHVDAQQWAAVVYLTPHAPTESGTTFYKSKVNGLRQTRITDKMSKQSNKSKKELRDEIFKGGYYDKTQFETVDVIGNVFNRLVIWDAKLIHAASEYFGSDINDSRLFHMFFFDTE